MEQQSLAELAAFPLGTQQVQGCELSDHEPPLQQLDDPALPHAVPFDTQPPPPPPPLPLSDEEDDDPPSLPPPPPPPPLLDEQPALRAPTIAKHQMATTTIFIASRSQRRPASVNRADATSTKNRRGILRRAISGGALMCFHIDH